MLRVNILKNLSFISWWLTRMLSAISRSWREDWEFSSESGHTPFGVYQNI